MNFSVPDDVRDAFNAAFEGENKSAVVARLMRDAVEEKERQARRRKAADALLRLRRGARPVDDRRVRAARRAGRA